MVKLVKLMLIIILLLESRFFYIIPLPNAINMYNTYNSKLLILLVILVTLITIMIFNQKKFLNNLKFNKIIIIFIFIYTIQFFISYVKYWQNPKDIILSSYYFLIPLLYYIIMYYFVKKKNISFFLNSIIIFSLIMSVLFILQQIVFSINSNFFLKIYEVKDITMIPIRNNTIRLTYPSTLISLSVILSFANLLNNDKSKKIRILNLINLVISSYYIIIVCQTRMLIICIVLSIFFMVVFKRYKNLKRKILYLFIIIILGIFILNADFTSNFFETFNSSDQINSTVYRMQEIEYFLKQFSEDILFGRGFIQPILGDKSFEIVHGVQGYLYTTDVGIIGLLSILGLTGTISFIVIIIKLLRMVIVLYINKCLDKCTETLGVIIFIICTSATLIVTDPQRIILLPIIMCIIETNYKLYNFK